METDSGGIREDAGSRSASVALAVFCLLAILALLLPAVSRVRNEAPRPYCRRNLNHLGTALALYNITVGRNREYPGAGGAEMLIGMYRVGVIPPGEAESFVCGASGDENHWDPRRPALARDFGGRECSYAGRDNRPAAEGGFGPLTDGTDPSTPIASDDTQGPENHPDGMNVLLFDGSVLWWGWDGRTKVTRLPGPAGSGLETLRN